MSEDFSSKKVAASLLRQLGGERSGGLDLGIEPLDILFKEVQADHDFNKYMKNLPSQKLQLSYFEGDIDKADWVAKNTRDVEVLRKFSRHRSVVVRRSVALNPATPEDDREKLMRWAIKAKDKEMIMNYNRALPLKLALEQLADPSSPFSYAIQKEAGLISSQLANMVTAGASREVILAALKVPDYELHGYALVEAYEGRAGDLTYNEAVEASKALSLTTSFVSSGPIANSIRYLLFSSSKITEDLMARADEYVTELQGNGHFSPVVSADEAVFNRISLRAAAIREGSQRPGGYPRATSKMISLTNGWDAVSIAAARAAAIEGLDHTTIGEILDVATLPAARLLVTNDSLTLNEVECGRVIKLTQRCTETGQHQMNDIIRMAESILTDLAWKHKLTDEQHAALHVVEKDEWHGIRQRHIDEQCPNKFTLGLVKAILALPDTITTYPNANKDSLRSECVEDLLRTKVDGLLPKGFEAGNEGEIREIILLLASVTPFTKLNEILAGSDKDKALSRTISRYLLDYLQDNKEAWEMFLSLAADWSTSLQELVDTTLTCVKVENPLLIPPLAGVEDLVSLVEEVEVIPQVRYQSKKVINENQFTLF